LIEENKKRARRVRQLDEPACRIEAAEILKSSGIEAGHRPPSIVVARVFDDRDAESLKHLALALIAHANVVALLGSRDHDTARLVFARSADASGDMNALMRQACEIVDGRGGGKADMAQGGGKNVDAINEALAAAEKSLRQT